MVRKGRRPHASERHRRVVLRFVIDNPGILAKDLIAFTECEHDTASKRLKKMCDIGELRRESVSERLTGSNRIVRTYRYWAVVTEIFTAEEVEQLLAMEEGAEKKPKKKESRPGVWFSNDDPDRKAIPNQGGQGASRPRCCSAISQLD